MFIAFCGDPANTGSITKIALVAGGKDVLVYTTISGAVGALVPFASMDDVEFMTTLEMVCLILSLLRDPSNGYRLMY
jgi:hypothetical protein